MKTIIAEAATAESGTAEPTTAPSTTAPPATASSTGTDDPILTTRSAADDRVSKAELPSGWQGDMDLARKYAASGPRYTSYPTAPQFSEEFDLGSYSSWQMQNARSVEPLSLYLHIPFCRDICYYCGCNKVVTRRQGVAASYLERLGREIALQSELVGSKRPVTQMHWGGGTPTFLSDGEITELMHGLASHFRLLDRGYREYSIEIDPRTVSSATIALLKGLGFNRISLGIQDFDPVVQQSINRIQPFAQVAELVEAIRTHGFRSLSFDLIYGLPHQHVASMRETLRKVLELRPDRIACYNYAHLPERFLPQRSIDRLTLPSPEEKLLLAQMISATLQDAGYRYIGMDHYVLPDDELARAQTEGRLQRNFQGYSLHMADDLLGLGVSSISQIGDFYLQNARDLPEYQALLDQGQLPMTRGYRVNQDDRLRRRVIMALICDLELDYADLSAEFGVHFKTHFAKEIDALNPFLADGLLILGDEKIEITSRGRQFLRNICMPFDAYLKDHTISGKARFSATV